MRQHGAEQTIGKFVDAIYLEMMLGLHTMLTLENPMIIFLALTKSQKFVSIEHQNPINNTRV